MLIFCTRKYSLMPFPPSDTKCNLSILKLKLLLGIEWLSTGCESTGLESFVPLFLFVSQCTDYFEGKNTFNMWIRLYYVLLKHLDHFVLMST